MFDFFFYLPEFRCNLENIGKLIRLKGELVNYLDTISKITNTAFIQFSDNQETESLANETITLRDTIVDNLTNSWFTEDNQSYVLNFYEINRYSYNSAVIGLIISLLTGQLIAFQLIKSRVNYCN